MLNIGLNIKQAPNGLILFIRMKIQYLKIKKNPSVFSSLLDI